MALLPLSGRVADVTVDGDHRPLSVKPFTCERVATPASVRLAAIDRSESPCANRSNTVRTMVASTSTTVPSGM
jgi:hypothetical protein